MDTATTTAASWATAVALVLDKVNTPVKVTAEVAKLTGLDEANLNLVRDWRTAEAQAVAFAALAATASQTMATAYTA